MARGIPSPRAQPGAELCPCRRAGEFQAGSACGITALGRSERVWHKCWKRRVDTHIIVLQKLPALGRCCLLFTVISSPLPCRTGVERTHGKPKASTPHRTGLSRSKAREKAKGSIWKVLLFIFLKYKRLSRVSNLIGEAECARQRGGTGYRIQNTEGIFLERNLFCCSTLWYNIESNSLVINSFVFFFTSEPLKFGTNKLEKFLKVNSY